MSEKKYRILVAGPGETETMEGGSDARPTHSACDVFNRDSDCEAFYSLDTAELAHVNGVVVPGGLPDVDPAVWGDVNTGCGVIDNLLDSRQLMLVGRAVDAGLPILGICRGEQLVSVYFGGKLIQDIAEADHHRYDPANPRFHELANVPGSIFYEEYGETVTTNSAHHQEVGYLPACLRIAQLWVREDQDRDYWVKLAEENKIREVPDEIVVEAVQHVSYPYIGLQWHPELTGSFACQPEVTGKIVDLFKKMMDSTGR